MMICGQWQCLKNITIFVHFIRGNHEASNYLQELPYGGWVAPNIYYMGRAGVLKFGNLRIAGLSGIFKGHDYLQGLWESPPYLQNSLRSVYHIRALDVFRLSQLKEQVHVMLSHDWPRGITEYGDKNNLLKRKPFLREDIESNQLGSAPAEKLLHLLKPHYWFAAHLHCQFAALVQHEGSETKFLALDKCLPKRRHLQILDLPTTFDGDMLLKQDVEWLAILKNTNHLLSVKNVDCHMPGPGCNERYIFSPTEEEKHRICELMKTLTITNDSFVMTAPTYSPGAPKSVTIDPIMNPQTISFCEKLGIDDPLQVVLARAGRTMKKPFVHNESNVSTNQSAFVRTPVKCSKLSLPAPVTPAENEDLSQTSSVCLTNITSDNFENTSENLTTPPSNKKIFKRRNLAMYTPDVDDCVNTSTSSLGDSDSPRSSKLPCRT
ncbi:lariat debranching enzyme isoform X2 [Battus philenor]|uniref:lariat debranching enzyme isoform X2 n=1 Tax=Battus philenor TaxID=42288 RepID=UPI0035D04E4F